MRRQEITGTEQFRRSRVVMTHLAELTLEAEYSMKGKAALGVRAGYALSTRTKTGADIQIPASTFQGPVTGTRVWLPLGSKRISLIARGDLFYQQGTSDEGSQLSGWAAEALAGIHVEVVEHIGIDLHYFMTFELGALVPTHYVGLTGGIRL
jgi:hypothetical protein